MFETNELRCVQQDGTTGLIRTYEIVRCADTGYYFCALTMLKAQPGYAVAEEQGPETLMVEDPKAAFEKCKSARYFGGPRVSPKIFETEDHFLIIMWNRKFGITFKTFSASNMGSAFLDMDDTEPEDEIADALFGESPDLEVRLTRRFFIF